MIRLMQESDIDEVLPIVREQERTTIARLGLDPEALLRRALGPFAYAGVVGDRVACLWGITFSASLGAFPSLWLLTTPQIEGHKIEFLRESRKFVQWARSEFGVIEGCVDCTNLTSRRWLEWLDFREVWSQNGYSWMRSNGH